jgi:hypothetical protein
MSPPDLHSAVFHVECLLVFVVRVIFGVYSQRIFFVHICGTNTVHYLAQVARLRHCVTHLMASGYMAMYIIITKSTLPEDQLETRSPTERVLTVSQALTTTLRLLETLHCGRQLKIGTRGLPLFRWGWHRSRGC